MCGIAGAIYSDKQRPAEPAVLRAMGLAIAHRGPDAEGMWHAAGIGLVHRRLSIIDLEGGDQPIGNEDDSLQVVFNGEIYNFERIRRELLSRGHRFSTRSDTEVLVHLYEEAGDKLVDRLRGMFAFALWDSRNRRLLLARDRLGQKPLYIYRDHEKLVFGSELKAILAHPEVDREIDLEALEDYLAFGFVPGSRSIFRRFSKLLPGHRLAVTADSLHAEPDCYWQWESLPPTLHRSASEWQEAVRAKVAESVKVHMIADVPVGAFLSGGVDSGVVVSHVADNSSQPIQTFSIGFHEAGFSELPEARECAAHFGCRHVGEVITPEAARNLDEMIRHYDEPFADSSAIPTMWVSRLAAERVKVALSGDGGDEAFGGYARYAHDLREAKLRASLPAWLRSVLWPLASVWPKADWLPRPLRAKTTLTNLALNADEAYANTLMFCRNPLRHSLLSPDVRVELNGHQPQRQIIEAFRKGATGDPLSGMIAADIGCVLPEDFLTKVDRASMAYGLEVRPPLVDHELLELAAQIPSELKVRGGDTKWILKSAYESRLPTGAVWRPKHGFDVPIDRWLRGPLREVFESTVLSRKNRAAGYIDQSMVKRLYRAHLNHRGRHGQILWSLLVLAKWAEAYAATQLPLVDAA